MSETSNPESKSTPSSISLPVELLEQLKKQLAEPLFAAVSDQLNKFENELQHAQLKIRVLEERLRLHRIAKYGPGSEKLTNGIRSANCVVDVFGKSGVGYFANLAA